MAPRVYDRNGTGDRGCIREPESAQTEVPHASSATNRMACATSDSATLQAAIARRAASIVTFR